MNGRLYDPLLRRFLNADENIQDPTNTQIYNKYGYAVNNPLMYNDPSGEVLPFLVGIGIGWFAATVLSGAIIGAAISMGIYILQATINNNFSWGGFAKSILLGAATGAVSAGLGEVFSATGFLSIVANGALTGAGTGGVTALITGQNFLEGVLKGVVIGGGVAAISYTANYYANGYNKPKYTTTNDIAVDANSDVEPDLQTMTKNIKDARANLPDNGQYKIESEGVGLSDSRGLMMNENGDFNILGRTTFSFGSGKSTILYSTKAASNIKLLGKTMAHETSHALSFSLGIPYMKIDENKRFDQLLYDVEHLAIKRLERIYALKNNILPNYESNYVEMGDILRTVNGLNSGQKILYNFMYNKFFPIFNKTFKFP
ncbi:hypothetical protein J2810_000301 [Chryseobacterium rhizosphaerae]|uniref:RHS repeat-associated core domain-containing protein n=1 Tax=Chryseobacterium rhizosphaerae TaxID=395937 RepID=UPI00285EC52C|nr:RHS repeat-associated core domain-containing protein [Chryseobacterium rhizosphaerae]MDR6544279.1 hypothetical protein [Chryseobacterium rhizosphaerae]